MGNNQLLISQVFKRQFEPAFHMLKNLIDSCPKALWSQKNIEPPIWQQFYHVLYGLDYWFSESRELFVSPQFGPDVNSVLGEPSTGVIEPLELSNYLDYVKLKSISFIEKLANEDFTSPSALYVKWTNLDVILEQLRHLQHHVGYLNRVYLKCKLKPAECEFYEPDQEND